MPTQFIEDRLPVSISEGSQGGPGFNTDVFESDTGFEQRNIKWELARHRYDIGYGIRSKEDMEEVFEFFYNVKGRAIGFRYKDWLDYEVDNQNIGVGTGGSLAYQVVKDYTVGSETYTRDIKKIVANTVIVTWNDVVKTETTHYVVDYNTGLITMTVPAAQVARVTCEFDVPVRFDIDQLSVTAETWLLESVENIPLVEIKPTS